jgi:dihydrofolate reductase
MINLIITLDLNNAINKEYHLNNYVKNFESITYGGIVVMDRDMLEKIGELPENRFYIIIAKDVDKPIFNNKDNLVKDVLVFDDIDWVIQLNHKYPSKNIFIIGGEELYEEFLPFTSRIYLAKFTHEFDNTDAVFPELDMVKEWKVVHEQFCMKNEDDKYDFYVNVLERMN